MKLKTLLFSAFMLTTFVMMAQQDWSSGIYKYGQLYPGYVTDADGNKTEGFIKYTNRKALQTDVLFYADKNDKKSKVKYKAKDLSEYKMADKVYHVIHYTGGLLSKPVGGNLLVEEGCISTYVYYAEAADASAMRKTSSETEAEFLDRKYPPTTLFLKDGDESPQTIAKMGMGFAKDMPEWIADQPELAEKVANKEKGYGFLNMHAVIEEYNANCEK